MKKLWMLAALAGAAVGSVSAQPRVGVSIGVNEPGVYGRVSIGNVPGEALVAPRTVIVAPPRLVVDRQPIYLYVAPWEQANWPRYCNRYAACGQPVYFVREDWIHERYLHEHPGWDRDHRSRGGPRDDRRYDGRGRDDSHRYDPDRR